MMMVDTGISREEVPLQGIRNSSLLTLIITPFIIAIIWQLENFLLAINPHLFSKANFPWLVLFTGTFVCTCGNHCSRPANPGSFPFGSGQHVPDWVPISTPDGNCCRYYCPCHIYVLCFNRGFGRSNPIYLFPPYSLSRR